MYELAMFPLEHTVLPGALLPLHIFEPRYRELAATVTSQTDPEFGTVLITRGREVGGDDERAGVGVVLRVIQAEEFPDGRWGILAAATRRLRVERWLEDVPFPLALVSDWPDDDAATYLTTIGPDGVAALTTGLARIRAATSRIDPRHAAPEPEFASDPARVTWQAAGAAGLGPHDALSLLCEPSASRRAVEAARLISERAEVLEALADQGG